MKTKELKLKIEDLEERIAPHLVIYPDPHSGIEGNEVHPKGGVHGRLGSPEGLAEAGEEWRISTRGTRM